jgi:hypothetical protein
MYLKKRVNFGYVITGIEFKTKNKTEVKELEIIN